MSAVAHPESKHEPLCDAAALSAIIYKFRVIEMFLAFLKWQFYAE